MFIQFNSIYPKNICNVVYRNPSNQKLEKIFLTAIGLFRLFKYISGHNLSHNVIHEKNMNKRTNIGGRYDDTIDRAKRVQVDRLADNTEGVLVGGSHDVELLNGILDSKKHIMSIMY